MSFQNILVENKGRIRYITINRESKMNALNKATLAELHTAFDEAFKDQSVGGIIVTGTGQKAFVAGADIAELSELTAASAAKMARDVHAKVFDFIENGSKPVIAAINGYALGGGLELALACHIRVAANTAKLGLPEVTLGLVPGYGGTQRLTKLIGKGKSFEMILTAEMVTAGEAYLSGLVNHVVNVEDVVSKAEELLNKILLRAPLAVAAAITAINAAGTPNGFKTEISSFSNCFASEDTKEGIAAFLEKRKPDFKGK